MKDNASENKLKVMRRLRGENQKTFWLRFGVTQSGGSRYEANRSIPRPLAILMQLHRDKVVTDEQLLAAQKRLAKANARLATAARTDSTTKR